MEGSVYIIQSISKPERVYVGSAVNINNRWRLHRLDLVKNKHHSSKLQHHYNKYGKDDLIYEIIESGEYFDKNHLLSREQGWYGHFHYKDNELPFFNTCSIAGSILGIKRSPEFGKKMSDIAKQRTISPEHLIKFKNCRKGTKQSEETKLKIKKGNTGKVVGQETREKLRVLNTGKHHTEETKRKMSLERKGVKKGPASEEAKQHMKKPKSEEHKQHMKDGWVIRKLKNPPNGRRKNK